MGVDDASFEKSEMKREECDSRDGTGSGQTSFNPIKYGL